MERRGGGEGGEGREGCKGVWLRPVSPVGKEGGGCAVKEDNFHRETPEPTAPRTMHPLITLYPRQSLCSSRDVKAAAQGGLISIIGDYGRMRCARGVWRGGGGLVPFPICPDDRNKQKTP